MRHLRGEGEGVGGGMPESCKVELDEKRRKKRFAFSVRVLPTETSERIRGGKVDLQKLLQIFLIYIYKYRL